MTRDDAAVLDILKDIEEVWQTVVRDLPLLIAALAPLAGQTS